MSIALVVVAARRRMRQQAQRDIEDFMAKFPGQCLPYTEPTPEPYPGRDCRAYGWDGAICLDDTGPFHPWPLEWEGRTPGETWVQFARYPLGCVPNGKDCDGREVTP